MQHSRIALTLAAALLMGTASLAGCGNNDAQNDNGGMKTNSVRKNDVGRFQARSNGGIHNIGTLDMDRELSARVAAIPGVRTANVLLAGRTAYVAVTADEGSGAGGAGGGTVRGNNLSLGSTGYGTGNGTGYGTGGGTQYTARGSADGRLTDNGRSLTGTGGTAASEGINGAAIGNGVSGRGITGGTGMTGGMGMTDGTGIGQGAAGSGRLNGTAGTDRGYRGLGAAEPNTTTNNASASSGELTKALKRTIADTVRQYDRNIGAVYVSANPDFVQRVNGYADQVRGGHPLSGFANEFRTLVERIFPTREE